MSAKSRRSIGKGAPGTRGPVTTSKPVSASTATSYKDGTYTPGIFASSINRSSRDSPRRFAFTQLNAISVVASSPSPISTASKKIAIGSMCVATGPPAMISGSSSLRFALRSGMPESSSIFKMLV